MTPEVKRVDFPQLLHLITFSIWAYPAETIVAEKLTTMMALGDLNTRDRDWADIWRLTGVHDMSGDILRSALVRTATYRGSPLRQLSEVVVRLPQLRRDSYTAWRRSQTVAALTYPENFADIVRHVIAFADPLISDHVGDRYWYAARRAWRAANSAE